MRPLWLLLRLPGLLCWPARAALLAALFQPLWLSLPAPETRWRALLLLLLLPGCRRPYYATGIVQLHANRHYAGKASELWQKSRSLLVLVLVMQAASILVHCPALESSLEIGGTRTSAVPTEDGGYLIALKA